MFWGELAAITLGEDASLIVIVTVAEFSSKLAPLGFKLKTSLIVTL